MLFLRKLEFFYDDIIGSFMNNHVLTPYVEFL